MCSFKGFSVEKKLSHMYFQFFAMEEKIPFTIRYKVGPISVLAYSNHYDRGFPPLLLRRSSLWFGHLTSQPWCNRRPTSLFSDTLQSNLYLVLLFCLLFHHSSFMFFLFLCDLIFNLLSVFNQLLITIIDIEFLKFWLILREVPIWWTSFIPFHMLSGSLINLCNNLIYNL